MLAQRLFTALILVPLVFAAVLGLPTSTFALLAGLVVLAAAWELTRLAGLESGPVRVAFLFILGAVLAFLYAYRSAEWVSWAVLALASWWLVNLVVLLSGRLEPRPFRGSRPLRLVSGLFLLSGAWLALVSIHAMPRGPALVMAFLVLIWVADSAAYFAGRRWGRRKLAPHISPGKTVAGALGAVAGGALFSLVFLTPPLDLVSPVQAVFLCVATVMVSIGGDLWESVLKRERGVKDSGRLLPGHGGVLDRIDSQIAAAPFFLAGLRLLGVEG